MGATEPMEAVDRYGAPGVFRHPPSLVCTGWCEGTGVVPVYCSEGDHGDGGLRMADEEDPALNEAWYTAEAEEPAADGWHFVICPTCNGTGIEGAPTARTPEAPR